MPSLFIVANKVIGANGHLQIVHASGSTWSGSTLTEVEVQSPNFSTIGNWDYRTFNQPFSTGGAVSGYIPLSLTANQSAQHVWQLIGQIHASLKINGAEIDYIVQSQNSNSFIKTLLYVIGNDQNWSASFGSIGLTSFPGWTKNVLFGAELGWTTSTGIALNLAGTAGNDLIRTGNGNDTLGGAAGNDTIASGAGNDIIDSGSGADSVSGGAGNDLIRGGSGMDTLYADSGRDTLQGGSDFDLLFGGTDSLGDVFIFAAVSESRVGASRDRIINFSAGSDDISLLLIDANSSLSGDQAFAWGGTVARANGIWITASAGSAIVNGDVNGDRIADFQIQLTGVTAVSVNDFFL